MSITRTTLNTVKQGMPTQQQRDPNTTKIVIKFAKTNEKKHEKNKEQIATSGEQYYKTLCQRIVIFKDVFIPYHTKQHKRTWRP